MMLNTSITCPVSPVTGFYLMLSPVCGLDPMAGTYAVGTRLHAVQPDSFVLGIGAGQSLRVQSASSTSFQARQSFALGQMGLLGPSFFSMLVESHRDFLAGIVRKFVSKPTYNHADLWQEAAMALLRAADRFNPYYGNTFLTYANVSVWRSVVCYCQSNSAAVDIPIHRFARMRKVMRASSCHEMRTGERPSCARLAQDLSLSAESVGDAFVVSAISSVEVTPQNEGGLSGREEAVESFLPHDRNRSSLLAAALDLPPLEREVSENNSFQGLTSSLPSPETTIATKLTLQSLLMALAPVQRRIITRLYGLDPEYPGKEFTLEEIGNALGLTRQRIQQIAEKAFERLQQLAARKSAPEPYYPWEASVQRCRAAVASLSPHGRELYQLFMIEGLSARKVAELWKSSVEVAQKAFDMLIADLREGDAQVSLPQVSVSSNPKMRKKMRSVSSASGALPAFPLKPLKRGRQEVKKVRTPKMRPAGAPTPRTDLRSYLQAMAAYHRDHYPGRTVEISVNMWTATKKFDFDCAKLNTILGELIENAIVHNPRATPSVWITCRRPAREIVFEIQDNGSGMSEALKAQVRSQPPGTPFVHEDGGKRTGFGLLRVRALLKEVGGRLEVLSLPGRGSIFEVHLPFGRRS